MKKISIIALLVAISFATVAAGASVTTSAGTAVNGATSAAAGGTGTSAAANASGAVSAQANTSSSVGVDVSASGSASTETGASVSSSNLSSALNVSSMSSADSSLSSMTSSQMSEECSNVSNAGMTTSAMDPATLAAVQTVTVFSISDCGTVPNSTSVDAATAASLSTNAAVVAAIAKAGYQGQQIAGYTADGTSLTVFVKQN